MLDAQVTPIQPYDAASDPYYRWGRYMAITIPMLAIAAMGAFLLPAHPELELYVHFLLVSTLVFYFYIRWQMDNVRNQPGYQAVKVRVFFGYHVTRYIPDDNRMTQLRKSLPFMLLVVSGTLAGLAEFQLILNSIGPLTRSVSTTYADVKFEAAELIMATIGVSIFSISLLRRRYTEKPISGRPAFYGFLLTFVAMLVGAIYIVYQVPTYLFPGPPASCPKLLAFAQNKAALADDSAILEAVTADPPYDESPPYTAQGTLFEVDFVFRRPGGHSIRMTVLDSETPKLLTFDSHWDWSEPAPTGVLLLEYKRELDTVTLGPRDIYRLTEAEGLAFGNEKNKSVAPRLSMYLGHDWQTKYGVPAGWNMEYSRGNYPEISSLVLHVDGATGRVVGREHWPEDFDKPTTPVPVASPTITP